MVAVSVRVITFRLSHTAAMMAAVETRVKDGRTLRAYNLLARELDSRSARHLGLSRPTGSGGASVLVSGAVFKTVSAPVRAGAGGFDSHTPPPTQPFLISDLSRHTR